MFHNRKTDRCLAKTKTDEFGFGVFDSVFGFNRSSWPSSPKSQFSSDQGTRNRSEEILRHRGCPPAPLRRSFRLSFAGTGVPLGARLPPGAATPPPSFCSWGRRRHATPSGVVEVLMPLCYIRQLAQRRRGPDANYGLRFGKS